VHGIIGGINEKNIKTEAKNLGGRSKRNDHGTRGGQGIP
jgi:hypothetical protein